MITIDSPDLSTKYKLLLALLALVGIIFILLTTNNYGAGISPDSICYIGAARNIIAGVGVIDFDGGLFVSNPPLYPALLALVGKTIGSDPFLFVNIVNALLFGLIVYLGGLLTFKYLSSFPALILIEAIAIIFSIPLFFVSVWAWSEPLFIFFMLLSLIFANSYLTKNDAISLILFSSSVALASLTRYVGVTLILWGTLTIFIFQRDSLKNRIVHISLFALISVIPIGLWIIRNYVISGTPFGPRTSSDHTLFGNLFFVFKTLILWFIPIPLYFSHNFHISLERIILILTQLGFVFICIFTGYTQKNSWNKVKVELRHSGPIVLFVIIYTAFLIISSTTTYYSAIDDRLLSPIYIPLTVLLLILTQALFEPYRRRFSNIIVNLFLLIGLAIWMLYPIYTNIKFVIYTIQNGNGYSDKTWRASETAQYLRLDKSLYSKHTYYTNCPDAVYILAHLEPKWSPAIKSHRSPNTINDISRFKGSWPEGSNAYLVWFDRREAKYLFTIDELRAIANINQIARLKDGSVYSVTRK